MTDCVKKLILASADPAYRDFTIKLTPSLDPETVVGVRTPRLREIAASLTPEQAEEFMKSLPHGLYEENNVHGYLIEKIKDYDACVSALDEFLPYVDNWATCDTCTPKVLKKYPARTVEKAYEWIDDGRTYFVRYGIRMLMAFFQDDLFLPEYADKVASVHSDEYYVNMMIAWYFATALAKQYDAALPYIENRRLDRWTHNKAIQKAIESYRVSAEQKAYLRTLRIK